VIIEVGLLDLVVAGKRPLVLSFDQPLGQIIFVSDRGIRRSRCLSNPPEAIAPSIRLPSLEIVPESPLLVVKPVLLM